MADKFNVLTVSRYQKFFDLVLPLVKSTCSGDCVLSSDTTKAQKILLTSDIDAVIINTPLKDGFATEFALECVVKKNLAVLMLMPKDFYETASHKLSASGILTLQKPANSEIVEQSLLLLKSTSVKLKKLAETKEKSDTANELKTIIRAKMLLIGSFGMSEEQAHKYIEKRAMEARTTKIQIAQNIIKAYGN